jgi:hypothetical protein
MHNTYHHVRVIVLLIVYTLTITNKEAWSLASQYTTRQLTHNCTLSLLPLILIRTVITIYNVRPLCPWLSTEIVISCWILCDHSKYSLLFLCNYDHSCFLHSVHCLSVPHSVPFVGSVSLCPLLNSAACPLSVSTSQCSVCWLCVPVSNDDFDSLSTVCRYLILYRLLALYHCVHRCLLQSVHCLSAPHHVPSVGSVSLCLLLSSTICLWVPHTLHSVGSVSLCSLLSSTICPLSVPHTVPSVGSVSLCPLQSSTVYPLSVGTSQCTVCWFSVTVSTAVFYSLSTVCHYLTMYHLLVLCHCVHCYLWQSVNTS